MFAGRVSEKRRNDIRFGARLLRERIQFLLTIAVLTLGTGIGGTSSVYSLVRGVLLTPPPYAMPERIVLARRRDLINNPIHAVVLPTNGLRQREAHRLRQWLVITGAQFPCSSGRRVSLSQFCWSHLDYFRVLGIHPELGRTFATSEVRQAEGRSRLSSFRTSFGNGDLTAKQISLAGPFSLTLTKKGYGRGSDAARYPVFTFATGCQ